MSRQIADYQDVVLRQAAERRASRWVLLSEAEVLRLDLSTTSLRQEAEDLVAAEAVDLDAPALRIACRNTGGYPALSDSRKTMARMLGGLIVRRVLAMKASERDRKWLAVPDD